jgi:2'-5' RNA ligase
VFGLCRKAHILPHRTHSLDPKWKGDKMVSFCTMSKPLKETTARVFFALWPDKAERTALAEWQTGLHEICGGRAMRADTLHATLVFLGDVALHRLEALQLAAQEVEGKSFDLSIDVACYWGHNHIVYAATNIAPPQLEQLVHDLEQRLTEHRFRFDRRVYKPHITLLRHAQWRDTALPDMRRVKWQARSFALVQSAPDEQGANYRVLAKFPLL